MPLNASALVPYICCCGIPGFQICWPLGTVLSAALVVGLLDDYGWRLVVVLSTVPAGAQRQGRAMGHSGRTDRRGLAYAHWAAIC